MTGRPRFVSFSIDGALKYAFVKAMAWSIFPCGAAWPTLREAIEAGALARLADEVAGLPADMDGNWSITIPGSSSGRP